MLRHDAEARLDARLGTCQHRVIVSDGTMNGPLDCVAVLHEPEIVFGRPKWAQFAAFQSEFFDASWCVYIHMIRESKLVHSFRDSSRNCEIHKKCRFHEMTARQETAIIILYAILYVC